MPTAHIKYLGQLRTLCTHNQSGSTITTDAPTDNHGQGANFSPTDLLSTSLGACMITVMGITANGHSFDTGQIEVNITKHMDANPRRVVKIQVELIFPDCKLTAKQQELLKIAALNCPVAKSIHPDIKQDVQFIFQQ